MMSVKRTHILASGRRGIPAFLAVLALAGAAAALQAQAPNPTSATNPFFGSVTAAKATGDTLKLSLDEAVRRGLENNLGLKEAENSEKYVRAERMEAVQNFLPNISLTGSTGLYQHNLAALGFGPGALKELAQMSTAKVSSITRDDLTQGQITYGQMLFSGPVIAAYKAAGAAEKAAYFGRMSARGEVVQQVATAYLHAIAAASEVDNAKALEAEDRLLFSQVHDAHVAGTVSNLDELRARVQLQAQQQVLIGAENALEKDLILLKREIGIDPGQKIALTDPAPYSDLATQTPEEVRAVAYRSRQDYQSLQAQVLELKAVRLAYKSQRLPSLSFGGYYGMSLVNGAGTRGNFVAQGSLTFPLFREARIRGDVEASQANLDAVSAELADLKGNIDKQVRTALMDVDATTQLVQVARSNVELATRALSDETDRVNAGVDDNLPLVTAQATLAAAQSNLVESLYQFNEAKLVLARAAGVLETQYRDYLGR